MHFYNAYISITVLTDPCEGDNDQCNGNGECVTTAIGTKEYTCVCYDGWSGQFCQGIRMVMTIVSALSNGETVSRNSQFE